MSASRLHGLLNLDKPAGMTSREVVNRVSRLAGKTRIGHAGTLDPLATGVLIICLGAATRLMDRIHEHRKGYRAGLKLGVRSDTDDVTGQVVPGEDPSRITSTELQHVLTEFQGTIDQIPPRYSAVHVDGRRAYHLVRSRREFELTARPVRIYSTELIRHAGDEVEIDVVCGSGMYVRSLIRDLGERLGCGAVMTSLRRTFIGPFRESDGVQLDQLTVETLPGRLLPLRSVLEDDPTYSANVAECEALQQGRGIPVPDEFSPQGPRVAVLDSSGELFAFATWDAEHRRLQPHLVFVR
jgi:tRNA pseudouridine55 synthase